MEDDVLKTLEHSSEWLARILRKSRGDGVEPVAFDGAFWMFPRLLGDTVQTILRMQRRWPEHQSIHDIDPVRIRYLRGDRVRVRGILECIPTGDQGPYFQTQWVVGTLYLHPVEDRLIRLAMCIQRGAGRFSVGRGTRAVLVWHDFTAPRQENSMANGAI